MTKQAFTILGLLIATLMPRLVHSQAACGSFSSSFSVANGQVCEMGGHNASDLETALCRYNLTDRSNRYCTASIILTGSGTMILGQPLQITGAPVSNGGFGVAITAPRNVSVTLDATGMRDCPIQVQAGAKIDLKRLTLIVDNTAKAVCDLQGNAVYSGLNAQNRVNPQTAAQTDTVLIHPDVVILPSEDSPEPEPEPEPGQADQDGDGIVDAFDFCDAADGEVLNGGCPADKCVRADGQVLDRRFDRNGNPMDADNDGVNDACDTSIFPDSDSDGVANSQDRCPGTNDFSVMNPSDSDGDRIWDACDPDVDGDGLLNADETARGTDMYFADTDGDGRNDRLDRCPLDPVASHQNPAQCGTPVTPPGNPGTFNDEDEDGIRDDIDNCIDVPNTRQSNNDNDRLGNSCDLDDDNDTVLDDDDNCPLMPNADQKDDDGDGVGNACQGDSDKDGVHDGRDNCLGIANPDQKDNDADGVGDACDINPAGSGLPRNGQAQLDAEGGGGCSLAPQAKSGPLVLLLITALFALFPQLIRFFADNSFKVNQ